jgi:hypothetical protein
LSHLLVSTGLPCEHNPSTIRRYINDGQAYRDVRDLLISLYRVGNSTLSTLVRDVYYGQNTFYLSCDVYEDESSQLYCFRRPPPQVAQHIKHLKIGAFECRIENTLEDMLLNPEAGWRWILKPTRPLSNQALTGRLRSNQGYMPAPNADQNTAWQSTFTKLQTLTITFLVDETDRNDVIRYRALDNYFCLPPERMTQIERWLQTLRLYSSLEK